MSQLDTSRLDYLGYEILAANIMMVKAMKYYIEDYIVEHGRALISNDRGIYDSAFNKGARVFPKNMSDASALAIKENGAIQALLQYNEIDFNRLCSYELEKNPSLKRDQYHIYWRLVRPFDEHDVGLPHRDSQFYEVDKEREVKIKNAKSWKLWIPIAGCTPKNSLKVIPGSHKMDVPIEEYNTEYGPKPRINKNWCDTQDWICPFNQDTLDSYPMILFHEDLVHAGPLNTEDSFRISSEITIYVN